MTITHEIGGHALVNNLSRVQVTTPTTVTLFPRIPDYEPGSGDFLGTTLVGGSTTFDPRIEHENLIKTRNPGRPTIKFKADQKDNEYILFYVSSKVVDDVLDGVLSLQYLP